jgi:hypothetical protein
MIQRNGQWLKTASTCDNDLLLKKTGGIVLLVDSQSKIREAGDSITRKLLEELWPDKDHFMLHIVACGGENRYLFNRKGDSWPDEDLEKCARRFLEGGGYYREHQAGEKHQRIGDIKAVRYVPDQGWLEMVIHGRLKPVEGSPLTAEPEYWRAKKGMNVDHSIAGLVPYDVCSCCGHKATPKAGYCDHIKLHNKEYVPEFGKFAFMRNFNPHFFDISSVESRADTIARFMGYYFPDGTEKHSKELDQDDCMMLPPNFMTVKLASALSDPNAERSIRPERLAALKRAAMSVSFTPIPDGEAAVLRASAPGVIVRKLSVRRVVLPAMPFMQVFAGDEEPEVIARAAYLSPKATPRMPIPLRGLFESVDPCIENCAAGDGLDAVMDSVARRYAARDSRDILRIALETPETTAEVPPCSCAVKEAKAEAWAEAHQAFKHAVVREMERQGHVPGVEERVLLTLF